MITLGDLEFDPATTAVVEKHEEAGGRDARKIRLTGLLENVADPEALAGALDDVIAAASAESGLLPLVLRAGRVIMVRRTAFTCEVTRPGAAARFVLDLEAPDPFEYAQVASGGSWLVGPAKNVSLTSGGNVYSPLIITLSPDDTVDNPTFFDGVRTIVYPNDVHSDQTLTVDGVAQKVSVNGEDVTPHTIGVFPRVSRGMNTLTFTGDNFFTATMTVSWRDRWW